jgi:DNA polymerase IV
MGGAPLTILHVDMDAYYASVEQRDRPELRGKPVIVGGTQGRGVVCAASYEARPFGVHSAMPISRARRLCPQAVFLPVRMGHYAAISRQIRAVFESFTPLVEPLSLDEAFLDVHGCEGLFGPAPDIARQIKVRIKSEVGLTASVGVACNKFMAKLAGDLSKPDGLLVVPAEKVCEFLAPLPVSRLWGVGAKGEKRLHALGFHTIGQLAAWPEPSLIDHFGAMGRHLWRLANGQDSRKVVSDRDAKSISTETTFAHDIGDRASLRAYLLELVDQLASRVRHAGVYARSLERGICPTNGRNGLLRRFLGAGCSILLLRRRLNFVIDNKISGTLFSKTTRAGSGPSAQERAWPASSSKTHFKAPSSPSTASSAFGGKDAVKRNAQLEKAKEVSVTPSR